MTVVLKLDVHNKNVRNFKFWTTIPIPNFPFLSKSSQGYSDENGSRASL